VPATVSVVTRATVIIAAVVLPGATMLTACLPLDGSTPTAGRCRVKFGAPYYLERNTGAAWVAADQDSNDTVRYPKAVNLTVILECRPGTWRLRYDVTATYQGQSAHANDASDQLIVASQRDCQVVQ
jgi:hypothetical protein